MRRAWLIACKDMKEAFGRRALVLRIVVPVMLMPIAYGVATGYALRRAPATAKTAGVVSGVVFVHAALVSLIGTLLGTAIAADAIAGEKERRSIEPLMAAPVTDREIFAGKVIAGFIPSMLGGYGAAILFFATAHIVSGASPLLISATFRIAGLILCAIPVVTAVFLAIGVIVSARSSTVASATQVSGLIGMPVFGGVIYLAFRATAWPLSWLLLILAAACALALLLLLFGARAMGREEIIARLD